MKKILILFVLLAGIALPQAGVLTGYANVAALKAKIDSIMVLNTRMLAVENGKVAWSDSNGVNGWYKRAYINALLGSKQDVIGFTPVPNTLTLSINGTAYDLSANRSWTVAGDTSGFWNIAYDLVQSLDSDTSNYTLAEIDSLLGLIATGGTISVSANGLDSALVNLQGGTTNQILSKISGTDYHYQWIDNTGGSSWDSTYAYQRISALEDTIAYFTNAVTSILAALDTCGCGAVIVDNTPPLPPTSYMAIGGTSETQYVTTWTDPAASDLDSIRWYEGSSADTSAMNWIASIVAGTETYTRTGRTANTTYWSAVKAIDDSGNVSYFSNVDSATTISSPCTPLALDTLALATAETGTVSPFSATYNTGGTFSATTGSKYAGTYGYQLLFNGTAGTNTVGGTIHEGTPLNDAGNTEVYAHGYFKISSNFQTANNAISELFRLDYSSSSMTGINIVSNASGIPYAWQTSYRDGNTNTVTTNFALDEWIEIELYHLKGTGSNSVHKIWVNGTLILDASNGASTYDITRVYLGTVFDSVVNTAYIWADEISVSTQRIGCP